MLILTSNLGETIHIGDDVTIKVTQVEHEPVQVKLGIQAPRHIQVDREEIYRLKERDKTGKTTKQTPIKQVYRIFHNYDIGDQSVYLASSTDPSRAATYCQFLAEDHLGDSASVLNNGIAKALIQFYDCTPAKKTDSAIDVDLYYAREGLCGEYESLMSDQSLQREGIIDLIRPHTEI